MLCPDHSLSLEEACCFNSATPRLPAVGSSLRWIADNFFIIELMTQIPSDASPAKRSIEKPKPVELTSSSSNAPRSVVIGLELSAVTINPLIPDVHIHVGKAINDLVRAIPTIMSCGPVRKGAEEGVASSSNLTSHKVGKRVSSAPVTLLAEHFSRFPLTGKGDLLFPIAPSPTTDISTSRTHSNKLSNPPTFVSFQQELLRRGIAVITMARYPNRRLLSMVEKNKKGDMENAKEEPSSLFRKQIVDDYDSNSNRTRGVLLRGEGHQLVYSDRADLGKLFPSSSVTVQPDPILKNFIRFTGRVVNVLRGDVFVVEVVSEVSEFTIDKKDLKNNNSGSGTTEYRKWPRIVANDSSIQPEYSAKEEEDRTSSAKKQGKKASRKKIFFAVVHLASVRCPNANEAPLYAPRDRIDNQTAILLHKSKSSAQQTVTDVRKNLADNAFPPPFPVCLAGMPYDGLSALRFSQKHFLGKTVDCCCVSFVPSDKDLANNTQESLLEQQEHFVGTVNINLNILDEREAEEDGDGGEANTLLHAFARKFISFSETINNTDRACSVARILFDLSLAKLQSAPEQAENSPLWKEYELLLLDLDERVEEEQQLFGAFYKPYEIKKEIENGAERDFFYGDLSPSLLQQHQRFCWAADPLQTSSVIEAGRSTPYPWGHHRLAVDDEGRDKARWLNRRHWEKSLRERETHEQAEHIHFMLSRSLFHNCLRGKQSRKFCTNGGSVNVKSGFFRSKLTTGLSTISADDRIDSKEHRRQRKFVVEESADLSHTNISTTPTSIDEVFSFSSSFFAGTDHDAKILPFIESFVVNLCGNLTRDTGCTAAQGAWPRQGVSSPLTLRVMENPLFILQNLFERIRKGKATNSYEFAAFLSLIPPTFRDIWSTRTKEEKEKDEESKMNEFAAFSSMMMWAVLRALVVRHEIRYQVLVEKLLECVTTTTTHHKHAAEEGSVVGTAFRTSSTSISTQLQMYLTSVEVLLEALGVIGPEESTSSYPCCPQEKTTTEVTTDHNDDDDENVSDENVLMTALLNDESTYACLPSLDQFAANSGDDLHPYRAIIVDKKARQNALTIVAKGLHAERLDIVSVFDLPRYAANGGQTIESSLSSNKDTENQGLFLANYMQAVESRVVTAAAKAFVLSNWYPTRPPPSSLMTRKTTEFEHSFRQRMVPQSDIPLKMIASLAHIVAEGKVLKGFVSNASVGEIVLPQQHQQHEEDFSSNGFQHFVLKINIEFTALIGQGQAALDLTSQKLRAANDRGEIIINPICSPMNFTVPVPASSQKKLEMMRKQQQRGGHLQGTRNQEDLAEWVTIHPFSGSEVPAFSFGYDPLLSGVSLEDVSISLSVDPVASITMEELQGRIHDLLADYKAKGGSFRSRGIYRNGRGSGEKENEGTVNDLLLDVFTKHLNFEIEGDEESSVETERGKLREAMLKAMLGKNHGGRGKNSSAGGGSGDFLQVLAMESFAGEYQNHSPQYVPIPQNLVAAAAARGSRGAGGVMFPLDLCKHPRVACSFFIVDVRVSYMGPNSQQSVSAGGQTANNAANSASPASSATAIAAASAQKEGEDIELVEGDNSDEFGEENDEAGGYPTTSAQPFEITKQMIFYVFDQSASTNALLHELAVAGGKRDNGGESEAGKHEALKSIRAEWSNENIKKKIKNQIAPPKPSTSQHIIASNALFVDTSEMDDPTVGTNLKEKVDDDEPSAAKATAEKVTQSQDVSATTLPSHFVSDDALAAFQKQQLNAIAEKALERQSNDVIKTIKRVLSTTPPVTTVDSQHVGFISNVISNAVVSTVAPNDYIYKKQAQTSKTAGGGGETEEQHSAVLGLASLPATYVTTSPSSSEPSVSLLKSKYLRKQMADIDNTFRETRVFASKTPRYSAIDVAFPLFVSFGEVECHRESAESAQHRIHVAVVDAVKDALLNCALLKDAILLPTCVVDDDPSVSRLDRQCLLGDLLVFNPKQSTHLRKIPSRSNTNLVSLRELLEKTAADAVQRISSSSSSVFSRAGGKVADQHTHTSNVLADCSHLSISCSSYVLPCEHVTREVAQSTIDRSDQLIQSLATELFMGLVVFDCLNYSNAPSITDMDESLSPSSSPQRREGQKLISVVPPVLRDAIALLKVHQKRMGLLEEEEQHNNQTSIMNAAEAKPTEESVDDHDQMKHEEESTSHDAEKDLPVSGEETMEDRSSVVATQDILSTRELASQHAKEVRGAALKCIERERKQTKFEYTEHAEGDYEIDGDVIPFYYASMAQCIRDEARKVLHPASEETSSSHQNETDYFPNLDLYDHLCEKWTARSALVHADDVVCSSTRSLCSASSSSSKYRPPILFKQTFEALLPPPTLLRADCDSNETEENMNDYDEDGMPITQRGIDRISLSLFSLGAQKLVELKKAIEETATVSRKEEKLEAAESKLQRVAAKSPSALALLTASPSAFLVHFSAFPRMLFSTHYDHHKRIMRKDAIEKARGFAHMDILTQRLRFPRLENIYKCGPWERSLSTLVRIDPMSSARMALLTATKYGGFGISKESKSLPIMTTMPSINDSDNKMRMNKSDSGTPHTCSSREGNRRDDESQSPAMQPHHQDRNKTKETSRRYPFLSNDSIITNSNQISSMLATLLFALPVNGKGSKIGEALFTEAVAEAKRNRNSDDKDNSLSPWYYDEDQRLMMSSKVADSLMEPPESSSTDGGKPKASKHFKRSVTHMRCNGVLEMILTPPTGICHHRESATNGNTQEEDNLSPERGRAFLLFGNAPSRMATVLQSPTDTLPRKLPPKLLTRLVAYKGVASCLFQHKDSAHDEKVPLRENEEDRIMCKESSSHIPEYLIDEYNFYNMGHHGNFSSASSFSSNRYLRPLNKDLTSIIFEDFAADLPHVMYRPINEFSQLRDSSSSSGNGGLGGWCIFGDPMGTPPALAKGEKDGYNESATGSPQCIVQYIPVRLPKGSDLYKQSSYGQIRRDDVYEVFMSRITRSLDLIEYCKLLVQSTRRGAPSSPACAADGTFKIIGNAHEPLYMMFTHRRTLRTGINLGWNIIFPLDAPAGAAALNTDPFIQRVTSRYLLAAAYTSDDTKERREQQGASSANSSASPRSVATPSFTSCLSDCPIKATVQLADAEEHSLKEILFASCEWLFWLIALRFSVLGGDGAVNSRVEDHLRTYIGVEASSEDRCISINVWQFTEIDRRAATASPSSQSEPLFPPVGENDGADGTNNEEGEEGAHRSHNSNNVSLDPADQHKYYGLENNVTNRMVSLQIKLHAKSFWDVREGIESGTVRVLRRSKVGPPPIPSSCYFGNSGGDNNHPQIDKEEEEDESGLFLGIGKREWVFHEPPSNLRKILSKFGLSSSGVEGGDGSRGAEVGSPSPFFPYIVEVTDNRE